MARRGRRHGKYRQATRLLKLLDHLRSRRFGASLVDLAEEFGVTERQIRRDLAALEEAGFIMHSTPTPDGRARVRVEGTQARSISLTLRERYGLLAARRVFDLLADTPFAEDVNSIYSKVAASLPDEHRADLATFGERFLFIPDGGTKAYVGKEDILDGLMTGVIRRTRVRYRYRPASGKVHEGLLEPYAMALYKAGLYVLGCAIPDGKERAEPRAFVFAAERFEAAEHVRGDRFEVPASFRLDEFFHGAFGIFVGGEAQHVVVDFTEPVRERVEARLWHRTQKCKRLPGGGVRLSFDVTNLTQVVGWVLEWGASARVREPPALVDAVARELRAAAEQYGKVPTRSRAV